MRVCAGVCVPGVVRCCSVDRKERSGELAHIIYISLPYVILEDCAGCFVVFCATLVESNLSELLDCSTIWVRLSEKKERKIRYTKVLCLQDFRFHSVNGVLLLSIHPSIQQH